jgi:hypothetical protein
MCFATAAAIAGISGSLLSAGGAVSGGYATANAANYQAAVAKNNQVIALQNAEYATEAGEAQANIVGLKGAETSGKVKAGQAASGIDVNTGSTVGVQAATREAGQLDSETVLNNAELQAYGYRAKATGFEAEAGLDTMKASQAEEAGWLSGSGGALSSASSIGLKWGGATPGGAPPPNVLPGGTGAQPY